MTERAATAAEEPPACLPALALLHGLADRCGLAGEPLARAAPSFVGQMAALFHNKEKGFKVINNSPLKF